MRDGMLMFCLYIGRKERNIYFKSNISLLVHSSHSSLIVRGVPGVSVVSQLVYNLLCFGLPQGKSTGPSRDIHIL